MTENSNKNRTDGLSKNYELYISDVEITNNCVLVDMNIIKSVYLGHFSFYTMSTTIENYCLKTDKWLNSILKKSTLISGVSEKYRYLFFKKIFKTLSDLTQKIKSE